MRADRLIAILLELQARGRTSSRKLAGKLEVSERTIHRDMEALSGAGIPVYALRGPDGGWELSEGYRTNLTAMQRTEVLALIFATAVSPAGTPAFRKDFEAAITRLLAAMPPQYKRDAELVRERIHVDGAAWCAEQETGEDLLMPRLQEAVWSCERLEIEYRRDGGYRSDHGESEAERPRRRTVRPLGLVAKRQTWYLVADTRDGMRSFRVSRIQSAKSTGKKFTRPKGFDLAEHWQRSVSEFRARLRSIAYACASASGFPGKRISTAYFICAFKTRSHARIDPAGWKPKRISKPKNGRACSSRGWTKT